MGWREAAGAVGALGYGASTHWNCEVVDIGVRRARVPLWAKVVGRTGRLFWRNLIWSGQWKTIRDGHKLVFGPSIGVVVKALPEGSQASLDLMYVSPNEMGAGGQLAHTCNWRTVGLLKSSGPVYVPSVTKKAPSTPSSLMLRSRS